MGVLEMRKKIILVIFVVMLFFTSSFVSAVNVNKNRDEKQAMTYPLTEEDFIKINKIINSIKDEKLKKQIEEIFDQIITEDGKFDIEKAENISMRYFKQFSEKIANPIDFKPNIPVGLSVGTSTVFEPPYSGTHSWGDKTWGADEYSYGSNKKSGGIGTFAKAWVGGATAESMQRLDFYVGSKKTVEIDAKILRTGGKSTFGIGAFAGTEKTWSWDDFTNNYHRSDVDPWWTWEIIIQKIISIIALLSGYEPTGILEAISYIDDITSFSQLFYELKEMYDDGNAKILNTRFSFSASPGYHSIWVGLRSTASACITGTGAAVSMGQVVKFTIDGIAAPEKPETDGPSTEKVGRNYRIWAKSSDPNHDEIRYFFDWGDGSNSGWSEYQSSGTSLYGFHKYSKIGTYKIKVIVEDIDKMQSEAYRTVRITSGDGYSKESTFNRFFNNFEQIYLQILPFFNFLYIKT